MKNLNVVSSKLTAFAAALAMNGLVLGALGYLFALQSHPNMSAISFATAVIAHQGLTQSARKLLRRSVRSGGKQRGYASTL